MILTVAPINGDPSSKSNTFPFKTDVCEKREDVEIKKVK